MIRYIIAVLVVCAIAAGAWASPPQHHHTATLIDGAKNPELIPDSTAWRLWLGTVSLPPNATEKERMFQQAHLATLKLSSVDSVSLEAILTNFKSQYTSLIARYNESAKALGRQADEKLFLQQREDLVSGTRTAIAQRLTPQGAARLDAHIQEQKRHMQVGVQGQ